MIADVDQIREKAERIISQLNTIDIDIKHHKTNIRNSPDNSQKEDLRAKKSTLKQEQNLLETKQQDLYSEILAKYKTNTRTINMFLHKDTADIFLAYLDGYNIRTLSKDSSQGRQLAQKYKIAPEGHEAPFTDFSAKERKAWYRPHSTHLKPFTQNIDNKVNAAIAELSPGGITRSIFGWRSEIQAERFARANQLKQEKVFAAMSGYEAGKRETPGAMKKYWNKTGGKVWGKVKSFFRRPTESKNATTGPEPAQSNDKKPKAAAG